MGLAEKRFKELKCLGQAGLAAKHGKRSSESRPEEPQMHYTDVMVGLQTQQGVRIVVGEELMEGNRPICKARLGKNPNKTKYQSPNVLQNYDNSLNECTEFQRCNS